MWAKDNALDSYVRVNLVGGWLSGFQGNLVSGSVGVGGGWETWVERIWWLTRSRFKTDQFVALHFLHAMLRTNCILVWSKKRVKAVFLYWLGKTWFSKCSNRSTPNLLPPWQGRVIKDKGELWCLGRRWVGLLVVVVVGKMVLKKWDSVLLFLEMLTTIWQLSENYLATIWQLFENCLATVWQLFGQKIDVNLALLTIFGLQWSLIKMRSLINIFDIFHHVILVWIQWDILWTPISGRFAISIKSEAKQNVTAWQEQGMK